MEVYTAAGNLVCPKCGYDCMRDAVHNGVGVMYGPWGCPGCRWSEWPEYDLSEGQPARVSGGIIDQYGGLLPIASLLSSGPMSPIR